MRNKFLLLMLVGAAIVLADCGRAEEDKALDPGPTASPSIAPGNLPPCARVEAPVDVPSDFPKTIPLPPGTILSASRHTDRGIVLEGVIPMERSQIVRFFLQKFAAAGFVVGRGESEEEEAEAPFRGNGLMGFFKIRNIRGCPAAMSLIMNVQTMPLRASPSASSNR